MTLIKIPELCLLSTHDRISPGMNELEMGDLRLWVRVKFIPKRFAAVDNESRI
jgi:hypothetical protein